MSAPVVPFTVHRGGRRPRRPRSLEPTMAQKMRRLQRENPYGHSLILDLLDRLVRLCWDVQEAG